MDIEGIDYFSSGVGACIGSHQSRRVEEGGEDESEEEGPEDLVQEIEKDVSRERKEESLSKEARRLLWKSVKGTARRGVERSCTIWIDSVIPRHEGKRVCQVDGGVWTGCDVSDLAFLWFLFPT